MGTPGGDKLKKNCSSHGQHSTQTVYFSW